jgi:hypothetical protein
VPLHARYALLLALALVVACSRQPKPAALVHLPFPAVPKPAAQAAPVPKVAPLTAELRAKGLSECDPYDPLGLGPYAPFRKLPFGKILIPQKGGHTPDMGYDVLIHFHGADATRKYLVQTARGMVLVLVDKGLGGGGPYTKALGSKLAFPLLRRSIEKALEQQSGSDQAHIRHLAVSAWSAGTEAIRKILEQEQEGIDAVVILDGLHGAWKQGAPRVQEPDSLDARFIQREIALADRARHGQYLFVLTHSHVDPYTFPSTTATAHLLLRELGLSEHAVDPGGEPFGQTSALDVQGLHVWGYKGKEEMGHCAQLAIMPRIVGEILERAWNTPAMDRNVPMTPHPDWAFRKKH